MRLGCAWLQVASGDDRIECERRQRRARHSPAPDMPARAQLTCCLLLCAVAGRTRAAEPVDYARQVRPILARHCYSCHGPDQQKSDLRLDTVASMLRGGNSGPAIVAHQSGASLLVDAVTKAENTSSMPPEGEGTRLSAEEVAVVRAWIDQGARAPAADAPATAAARKNEHWAYQPLARPTIPSVRHAAWVRNPIDAFVLARLETAGLAPSPEADRHTLIRRLSLDLLGLPPSPAEVSAFVNDTAPEAYERLVDRLLASPHYGERWGRHWLDLARYADSNGYTIDGGRSIWKYRDWVIAALNRDLPFDEFAIEQMAGDMLPKAATDQIVATGFHRNTLKNEEGGTDQEQFRVEAVVDRVSTTGSVFLGLTVGCARCHDHKYDAVSQREFYQLFALLNNADEPSLELPTTQQAKEEPAIVAEIEQVKMRIASVEANLGARQAEWEARLRKQFEELDKSGTAPDVVALGDEIRKIVAIPAKVRSKAHTDRLRAEYRKYDIEIAPLTKTLDELLARQKQIRAQVTTTLVLRERKEPRETFVHLRGDFLRPGAKVQPGVPAVLPELRAAAGGVPTRLDFARWLVAPENPLTPRVTVNRVWQQYFGQGIVATENDFGTQGDAPTHAELLDWLAREFMARNWSMKALHRLIVGSATYRQASVARGDVQAKDPYNKLLARQARLRLEAEAIRDSALAASGLLSREVGGPGVYPPQPEGIYRFTQQQKYWKESQGADRYRRAMYTYFWRSSPYPFLTTFDAPDANTACTRRVRSNTPLQALTLANDRAFVELAEGLAQRVLREAVTGDRERVSYAVRLCLMREPSPREEQRLLAYLAEQRRVAGDGGDAGDAAAWSAVARVLLNLDEFVTRE